MADPIEASAPPAVADRRAPSALGLRSTARRLGHYRWVEQRLFEMLGAWATSVPEALVAVRLGVHCHQHAWHVGLWRDRFPALHDLTPEQLTVAPDERVARFLDAVAEPDDTLARVVGVYRVVLPHLVAECRAHLDHTNDVTDGPTARVLSLVLRDLVDHLAEGESMVAALEHGADDSQRAESHRHALEQELASAGGLMGTDTPDLAGAGFRQ
ncbi:MAG: hypothetical protein ACO3C1_06510 [Ilumatobacteraceae bacterium]